jgi:luciferase family oxidoreductase group 1
VWAIAHVKVPKTPPDAFSWAVAHLGSTDTRPGEAHLSLLDRSHTRVGEPDAAALSGTVARAVRAEQLGFDRFWVAEHHGVPGVAGAAPAVLLAAIAGRTTTIRLGSAGVMLPHHQPLVVAEQFATLSAFAPGRVDLGLGRSPGFTPPVRRALREADRISRPTSPYCASS